MAAYATTFRYRLKPLPTVDELRVVLVELTSLYKLAVDELLA